ncbi:MAG: hypothetical protein C4527_03060 [Candidatus Omnitrophota bacterium]|jgi:hypothetical protein|nr:MAG: hypothetical protein C4527_03060 [Candidatus Omnitrophota bacterium]
MPLFYDGRCPELKTWSEFSQILGFTVCALLANFIPSTLIHSFHFLHALQFQTQVIDDYGMIGAVFLALGRPIILTGFGQWLPMIVAGWQKKTLPIQLLWAAIWFAILHVHYGPTHLIQYFAVGWVLASCFVFCRQDGLYKAYRVTTIVHALHNIAILLLFYYFQYGK